MEHDLVPISPIHTKKDERVDSYIEKAQSFAKPILRHLRHLIWESCPTIEETIKWNSPHFLYHGLLCSMAAFQEHCAFVFWKGILLKDPHGCLDRKRERAMGHFGRITLLQDLPADAIIVEYLHEAMALNEKGVTLPQRAASDHGSSPAFDILTRALRDHPRAEALFDALPPSKQREYIEWIQEAKREATRTKRLAQAIEWLSEGKSRHWQYEDCKSSRPAGE